MTNLLLAYSAGFGLLLGSFLDCLLWRLKTGETLLGRSFCPRCHKTIAWYDNIPVLSFLLLGRKCRNCRKPISWQYPLIEVVLGLLFAGAAWRLAVVAGSPEGWLAAQWLTLLRDWVFAFALVAVFISDMRWYLIFDEIVIPAGVVLFILNIALGASWPSLLLSATIGTGFFLLQYAVSRGRWIGGGDIRLGFLLGSALGWPLILPALMAAYLVGAPVGVILIAAGKKEWGSRLPLGVFLCIGALVAALYGNTLIDWYLHLIHFS